MKEIVENVVNTCLTNIRNILLFILYNIYIIKYRYIINDNIVNKESKMSKIV